MYNVGWKTVDLDGISHCGEWSLAEERVGREAFPNGAAELPSPRAEVYVATGEWDNERSAVPLRLISPNMCADAASALLSR
jgi:hypothetical protein